MKRHALKKLKKAMRRTVSLLLAVLMLNISAFAADPDEKALRELYGDDWKAVTVDGKPVEVGKIVRILKLDSVIVTVEEI